MVYFSQQAGMTDNINIDLVSRKATYVGTLASLLFLMYSSRMSEQFIGEEPSVKLRCNGFLLSMMKVFILSPKTDSKILDMVGVIAIPRYC